MDKIKNKIKTLHWKKYLFFVGSSCFLDISASLNTGLGLKPTLFHLGIIFFGTTGAFLAEAYKKLKD